MKKVDICLKQEYVDLLKSLLGQKLIAIFHDSFVFTNTSSEIVKLEAENTTAFLYSFVEPIEHFGAIEDTAVWSFETTKYPAVESKVFIKTPVQEIISKIELVQESQRLFSSGMLEYQLDVTRGIIITLESGRQIAFEKDVWFSEEIIIHRGYDLYGKFTPVESLENNRWAENNTLKCTRTIVQI